MTRSSGNIGYFAVLCRDGNQEYINILSARVTSDVPTTYHIESVPWDNELVNARIYQHSNYTRTVDKNIYDFEYTYANSHDICINKYWYLPFQYFHNGTYMPFINFHYTSLLPSGYTNIPIRQEFNHIINVSREINAMRYDEMDRMCRNEEIPRRNSIVDLNTALIQEQPLTTLHVYSPQDLSPILTNSPVQPQSIPRHVVDILINHARSGTDACSITAIPYRECQNLSLTSCFHIFETESIRTWQTTNNTCPVCRSTMGFVIDV